MKHGSHTTALMQQSSILSRCSVVLKQNLWTFPLPSVLVPDFYVMSHRSAVPLFYLHTGLKREFKYTSAKNRVLYQFVQGEKKNKTKKTTKTEN